MKKLFKKILFTCSWTREASQLMFNQFFLSAVRIGCLFFGLHHGCTRRPEPFSSVFPLSTRSSDISLQAVWRCSFECFELIVRENNGVLWPGWVSSKTNEGPATVLCVSLMGSGYSSPLLSSPLLSSPLLSSPLSSSLLSSLLFSSLLSPLLSSLLFSSLLSPLLLVSHSSLVITFLFTEFIITLPVSLWEGCNCRLDVAKLPEDGASRA